MAKLKEITVSISRKLSDDNYGSFGVQAGITLEVAEGEDKDELYAASASWLSAKVAGTHKSHGTAPSKTAPPGQWGSVDADGNKVVPFPEPTKATPTPLPAGAKPAPVATGDEDVFNVDTIMVEFMPDGVTKSAKAKGGRWSKYGVKVWPEVLLLPPLEWDLDSLDAAEYPVPKGLQAIVMMHEGKPRKVLEWK